MPAHLQDRPLPHNLEAERSILGAILLDNQALATAVQYVRASDFFLPQNRQIFTAMMELGQGQQAIDTVTLMERLATRGELENVGGVGYLSQLADGLPRVTNVEHYSRIVRTKATLRAVIHSAAAIQEQAFDSADDPHVILTRANEQLASLAASHGFGSEPNAWREIFDTYQDFENCPPLSFAIEGFLQNDGATMIGGLSGHGKTLILLSMAKALLGPRGAKLWGLFHVSEPAARVIYLIPESSRTPFKHRLKLFRIYHALTPDDDRLLVRTLSKGNAPILSDPRILFAVKGAHVFLDTASRFGDGDENSANDNARGLANDIFALLASGARSVVAAHHSPKSFSKENTMRLENVLRGSGDVGAMLTTAWGIRQIDAAQNIIHIENIKPRDFQPCGPFQIIGRPLIDDTGDFGLYKDPEQCGALMDEQPAEHKGGGAPGLAREARSANIELLRGWLADNPGSTSEELVTRYANAGICIARSTIRKYKMELEK